MEAIPYLAAGSALAALALAYVFYGSALLFDIGRPWHAMNPFIGNDFGCQRGPLLSEPMFRRFMLPHLKRLTELDLT